MPTSLFTDNMERSGLEDQRALQLALELSMLAGLNDDDSLGGPTSFDNESRGKKSQNMTECVPVPSSEHVAEIVGRQGCKIKALRAKTNTYIKTPVRGEEPVFVVTGRKEDVNMAKREILSAAEHFSQIRASRKNNLNGSLAPGPPSNVPGQTTIQVQVPYKVVGLVVGPKGATIKRIQQQTHTYIVTPSRDKEPMFEVTGLPENVENARKEIEAHIAMRTGGMVDQRDQVDFTNGMDHQTYTGAMNFSNDFVSSLYSKSATSNLNGLNLLNSSSSAFYCDSSNNILGPPRSQDAANIFNFAPPSSGTVNAPQSGSPPIPKLTDFVVTNGFGLYESDEGIAESPTFDPTVAPPGGGNIWPELGSTGTRTVRSVSASAASSSSSSSSLFGGGPAPRRSSSVSGPAGTSGPGPGTRMSPPLVIDNTAAVVAAAAELLEHPPARRIRSDPLTSPGLGSFSSGRTNGVTSGVLNGFATTPSSGSASSSPTESLRSKRNCSVCYESEVVAALVPCGHNLFCLECANRLCDEADPICPVCKQAVTQAIRIYS